MIEKEELLNEMDEELQSEEKEDNEQNEEKRRKKAEALWVDVQMGNDTHLITKVASIMNRFPETRNSDIALMIRFWKIYQNHSGDSVRLDELVHFQRLTSIARSRAKIQNEYGLFKANEKIRRFRSNQEEEKKEYELSTKPEIESIFIYADESGKNDTFVIVGSFWILSKHGELNSNIIKWIGERQVTDAKCPDEFHFNKIRNNGTNLQIYKDFFNFVIANGAMTSFKAIAVNKTKINKPIDEIITELFYQLVRLGVEHEQRTNRFSFPKQVSYIKDHEEGESALRLSQIQQSLLDNFKIYYEDKLKLNSFISLDSKLDRHIQIADLFTGAINRKLNVQRKDGHRLNAKDELTNHILDVISLKEINYSPELYNQNIANYASEDMATLYIFD